MIELVRKRHDGDGWIVVEEIKTRPGPNQGRRADAVALSVWASKKFEAHLYEFKETREDLKREIRDPTKVEGVGKHCTYWWMCVREEKLLADLVVPEAWGILVVHTDKVAGKAHSRFKVVRKAPRQKPEPIGVLFAVELIRNIRNRYVDPVEHRRLQEQLYELRHGGKETAEDHIGALKYRIEELEREQRRTKEMIERFEKASGVELGAPSWDYGHVGEAVAVVRRMHDAGRLADGNVLPEIAVLSKTAEDLERRAKDLAKTAIELRALQGAKDHAPRCATKRGWGGRCDCGLAPLSEVERKLAADAQISSPSGTTEYSERYPRDPNTDPTHVAQRHVDQAGGVDRRGAGSPQQDAGVQLRDQRHEVPHGEPAP